MGSWAVPIIVFQISDAVSGFEFNNKLLILIIIWTLFITIILFELLFFCLLLLNKVKNTKCGYSRQSIGNSIKFQFTNSKAVLIFILGVSIIFAKYTSEQINDVLLGNINSFDYDVYHKHLYYFSFIWIFYNFFK